MYDVSVSPLRSIPLTALCVSLSSFSAGSIGQQQDTPYKPSQSYLVQNVWPYLHLFGNFFLLVQDEFKNGLFVIQISIWTVEKKTQNNSIDWVLQN